MTKIEITEDRPLSYTCHDGTAIVVSVAGPVEKVYTLTVGGERRLSDTNEDYVRYVARAEAEARNERYAAGLAPRQITSPLVESERQCSGLAGGGAAANAMSTPVREMLADAAGNSSGVVYRGRLVDGRYPLTMLRAAQRRGWLRWAAGNGRGLAFLTPSGRRALAAELARTGGAR